MITVFLLRLLSYTVAPLVGGVLHVRLDPSVDSAVRRREIMLIYLFSLGVGISGFAGAFGHLFLSDIVADSIGWAPGSPFQLEIGFANLALGVLGAGAVGRRDGFREATVAAVAVLGVGATIVHVLDIVSSGNLAPGNTIQNLSNLARPALLIAFLTALRRAERGAVAAEDSRTFDRWRGPRIAVAWWFGTLVATGFSAGFFAGRAGWGTAIGLAAAVALVGWRARAS